MEQLLVKSILASSDDELENKLNEFNKYYKIIHIIFIGNNPRMERIYQVVVKVR